MPAAVVKMYIPAKSAIVFKLLHDYDRRLEWDTLLRYASLTRGNTKAQKGATSLCVGKSMFGIIRLETEYITVKPDSLAAVKMINDPPFFSCFAASIRHKDQNNGSIATYNFQFHAKPSILKYILEPIMLMYLKHETKKRLNALAHYFAHLE